MKIKVKDKLYPKDNNDYYPCLKWLISKRLVFFIVLVIGILSIFLCQNSVTYPYNSILLRFFSGDVRIKAKSGYVAYEGEVKKGKAEGEGTLYGKSGNRIYTGAFKNSMYNGEGTLFYENGQIQYKGEFKENEFYGIGELYRENGSIEYKGGFYKGKKEGEGRLYNNTNHLIFAGNFLGNQVYYEELLGKSTEEIASMYSGAYMIYKDKDNVVVALEEISALYQGSQEASLENGWKVGEIYVCKDWISIGREEYFKIEELKKVLGNPVYEGNTYLTMAEAVCLEYTNRAGITILKPAIIKKEPLYQEVVQVAGLETDYMVYLYTYEYGGLFYSFYCQSRDGEFAMYQIEKAEVKRE